MKVVIDIPEVIIEELPNWVIIPTKVHDVIKDAILKGTVLEEEDKDCRTCKHSPCDYHSARCMHCDNVKNTFKNWERKEE